MLGCGMVLDHATKHLEGLARPRCCPAGCTTHWLAYRLYEWAGIRDRSQCCPETDNGGGSWIDGFRTVERSGVGRANPGVEAARTTVSFVVGAIESRVKDDAHVDLLSIYRTSLEWKRVARSHADIRDPLGKNRHRRTGSR